MYVTHFRTSLPQAFNQFFFQLRMWREIHQSPWRRKSYATEGTVVVTEDVTVQNWHVRIWRHWLTVPNVLDTALLHWWYWRETHHDNFKYDDKKKSTTFRSMNRHVDFILISCTSLTFSASWISCWYVQFVSTKIFQSNPFNFYILTRVSKHKQKSGIMILTWHFPDIRYTFIHRVYDILILTHRCQYLMDQIVRVHS